MSGEVEMEGLLDGRGPGFSLSLGRLQNIFRAST
jgi:hypothetical protein